MALKRLLLIPCALLSLSAYPEEPMVLGRTYLTCMQDSAKKFNAGGASMELSLDTAAIKCEPHLDEFRTYYKENQGATRASMTALDATLSAVKGVGRVKALETLTDKR